MSTMPAPDNQKETFIRLQLAVDVIAPLGDPSDPPTYAEPDPVGPDGNRPYRNGPDDEALRFGRMWWRYLASGAYYCAGAAARAALAPHASASLSLGACAHGMSRALLHLSQLDDTEVTKTIAGMRKARHLALAAANGAPTATATHDLALWPQSGPAPRPGGPETAAAKKRLAIASANFTLIPGGQHDSLQYVNHEYLLRLCQVQGAIDDLRQGVPPYESPSDPTMLLDAVTEVGPAWATFYNCAMAHAVGGPHAAARLKEIGMPFDAETCLAGVAETYNRLHAMNATDRQNAFASIDCSDYYFDPAPNKSPSPS